MAHDKDYISVSSECPSYCFLIFFKKYKFGISLNIKPGIYVTCKAHCLVAGNRIILETFLIDIFQEEFKKKSYITVYMPKRKLNSSNFNPKLNTSVNFFQSKS